MKSHVSTARSVCAEIPEFERLNYFYGQALSAADFRGEQAYLREKLKLHNRCLHGFGVISGFEVEPVPVDEGCPPDDDECGLLDDRARQVETDIQAAQEQLTHPSLPDARWRELQQQLEALSDRREELRRKKESRSPKRRGDSAQEGTRVRVRCGFALDCFGNELVLREAVDVTLLKALQTAEQRRCKEQEKSVLYLSICYCDEPTHPSRPVLPDSCGAFSGCNYGKSRDSVRFHVSLEPPRTDDRCETCCTACEDGCLLLAKITWDGFSAITEADIDNSVRRPISLYRPTVITGVSWAHGWTYSQSQAQSVLGTRGDGGTRTDGIEVVFSRPVYAETLAPGVVDLWRVQGGRGLRGVISHIEGDYVNKPDSGLINSFHFRDESGETLNEGDRIIVVIRGDFILDACCRPIDGNHVGGRVPQLESYREQDDQQRDQRRDKQYDRRSAHGGHGEKHGDRHKGGDCKEPDGPRPCSLPPNGIGPWTTGNGTVGGTFESWFYVD
jgi:hypothetical protein